MSNPVSTPPPKKGGAPATTPGSARKPLTTAEFQHLQNFSEDFLRDVFPKIFGHDVDLSNVDTLRVMNDFVYGDGRVDGATTVKRASPATKTLKSEMRNLFANKDFGRDAYIAFGSAVNEKMGAAERALLGERALNTMLTRIRYAETQNSHSIPSADSPLTIEQKSVHGAEWGSYILPPQRNFQGTWMQNIFKDRTITTPVATPVPAPAPAKKTPAPPPVGIRPTPFPKPAITTSTPGTFVPSKTAKPPPKVPTSNDWGPEWATFIGESFQGLSDSIQNLPENSAALEDFRRHAKDTTQRETMIKQSEAMRQAQIERAQGGGSIEQTNTQFPWFAQAPDQGMRANADHMDSEKLVRERKRAALQFEGGTQTNRSMAGQVGTGVVDSNGQSVVYNQDHRGDVGDQVMLQAVDYAMPTLRPQMPIQDPKSVIPSVRDQIQSNILFDMFSIVQPGFGEGPYNKLFQYETNWFDNVRMQDQPVWWPSQYLGQLNYTSKVPWQWQDVKHPQAVHTHMQEEKMRGDAAGTARAKAKQGSTHALVHDIGFPHPVSAQGLKRPRESVLEPVIQTHDHWTPVFDPSGLALNKRGFKSLVSPNRYEMLPENDLHNGIPNVAPFLQSQGPFLHPLVPAN